MHPPQSPASPAPAVQRVALVVAPAHSAHVPSQAAHPEVPARLAAIVAALADQSQFDRIPPRPFPDRHITAVHAPALLRFLARASHGVSARKPLLPVTFALRDRTRPPRTATGATGWHCFDTETPLSEAAFRAARSAVDCTLTAALQLTRHHRLAYALVRPPGHHAERDLYGGYCYLNNTAIAAHWLSRRGRVAVLDVDYHHGNGTQQIFYARGDVLTVSIHADPRLEYPYFSGHADERGIGAGEGANLNLPLPLHQDGPQYQRALAVALARIRGFAPDYLVIAFGADTANGDPISTFRLRAADFHANGALIGALGLPTLVVQEGGYRLRTLGNNVRAFLGGLAEAAANAVPPVRDPVASTIRGRAPLAPPPLRTTPRRSDRSAVRHILRATGFFHDFEIDSAITYVDDALTRGDTRDLHCLFGEDARGRVEAFACHGSNAMTRSTHELYWLAVHPEAQGSGLGSRLLAAVETAAQRSGATALFIETAGRPLYEPTRAFYRASGYRKVGELADFYAPGDAKIIYRKRLEPAPATGSHTGQS